MSRFHLVYQAGIANVFRHESTPQRVYQGDFRTAEAMCRGILLSHGEVKMWSCNRAGDITRETWTPGLVDCPFRDNACPPSGIQTDLHPLRNLQPA